MGKTLNVFLIDATRLAIRNEVGAKVNVYEFFFVSVLLDYMIVMFNSLKIFFCLFSMEVHWLNVLDLQNYC